MKADAVVVGAGASGLACARALADAGARVVVLEARDRVGGRIHTLRLRGEEPVELGAHVVHGAEACTWDVLRRAGIETTRLPTDGVVVAAAGRTYDAAELVAAGVVPPWLVEALLVRADVPDASVGDVLAGAGLRGLELALAREWLVQVWGGEADELSAAGVRRAKAASTAGEGEFAVTEGYDVVAAHLARGLDVRLGSAARLVARRPAGVEVELAGGGSVRAAAAVVTIPPPVVVAGRLRFDPPLPRAKALAARAIRLCDALAVVARLDRPASGTAWGLAVGETSGFWRAREGSRVVLGVLKGASAGRLRRGGVDAGVASGLLRAVFPWLRQAAVEDVSVADWGTDPFALGAFSYPRVGALDAPSAWAEPVEASIFFAGEATCRRHAGTVHGAIESGVRSAGEVLAVLDPAAPNRGVDPEDEPSAVGVAGRGGRDGKRGGQWP